MSEHILEEILLEIHSDEFSEYDNSKRHRFSRKHKRAMKRIFAPAQTQIQISKNIRLNRRTAVIIIAAIFLAVISATATAMIFGSFGVKNHKDNTELFAINTENCPVTLEKMYYLSGLSEDYVLYEENISPETAAVFSYHNIVTDEDFVFMQWVKKEYNAHFDNEHNNNLEYLLYDGRDAYYQKSGTYSVLVWDNGDYIIDIFGNMDKTQMMDLGRTLKIKK
ncbi:MAG: DUF4367 domain-containing protein [Oscillospiraceae bacterium]|nr:DUF4367 domain-containing protein [Oscillospiraceae bacterium]